MIWKKNPLFFLGNACDLAQRVAYFLLCFLEYQIPNKYLNKIQHLDDDVLTNTARTRTCSNMFEHVGTGIGRNEKH